MREEILRVILSKPDWVVKTVRTQKMFQGFRRSIYLDVYAEDSKGTRYNIEIQQSNEGADSRRARFHMGMVDVHSLKSRQNFRELPECYVIFITQEDVLKRVKTIYTIHKYIDGYIEAFDDGSHTIYINGTAKDDGTDLWRLIYDLHCTNADEMYFPCLAAQVKFLKEDEEGMAVVSDYFEELQAKAVREAEKKTAKQEKENLVLNLLHLDKLTLEIASCSGLTLKRVQLAKTLQSLRQKRVMPVRRVDSGRSGPQALESALVARGIALEVPIEHSHGTKTESLDGLQSFSGVVERITGITDEYITAQKVSIAVTRIPEEHCGMFERRQVIRGVVSEENLLRFDLLEEFNVPRFDEFSFNTASEVWYVLLAFEHIEDGTNVFLGAVEQVE